ncbi:MAG: hypothetical protein AB8B68_02740 [Rickettsiaceae bacterium]
MTTSEKIKAQDKKSSHLSTKATISKQKNSIKRFVLAFALLFGLVLYITFSYKELWLGAINRIDIFGHNNNTKDVESSSEEQGSISEKADKIVEDADKDENENQTNSLASQDGEDLPRFAPDEQDLDILNEEEDLNPYDHEIKEIIDDNTQIISDVNMINNLNDYRIYLANVHEFLYKFSKDQPYSENLDIIVQIELPKEFTEMIEMLKIYNDMLLKTDAFYQQIPLFNTDIFNKFFKIKQETDSYKEIKFLKVKIENKIDLFTSYAFSLDLQEQFLE